MDTIKSQKYKDTLKKIGGLGLVLIVIYKGGTILLNHLDGTKSIDLNKVIETVLKSDSEEEPKKIKK